MKKSSKISPALFGIIILCFVLPFVSVSCGGTEIFRLSGMDFLKGMSDQGQSMDPNPLAIIALIAAIIGICIGFSGKKAANMGSAALGLIGFVSGIALKVTFDSRVAEEGAQTSWQIGYFLMLILFGVAAVYNIVSSRNRGKAAEMNGGFNYAPPLSGSQPGNAFCTQCGSKLYPGQEFCTGCGTRLAGAFGDPVGFPAPLVNDPALGGGISADTEVAATKVDDDMTRVLKPPLTPVLKIDRSGREEIIRLSKDQFVIGRSSEGVDYSEQSSNAVSRRHVQISTENGAYYITDLNSQNGTFLNDQRLDSDKKYAIRPGDSLKLADLSYLFDEM